jgi:hypothetical protein
MKTKSDIIKLLLNETRFKYKFKMLASGANQKHNLPGDKTFVYLSNPESTIFCSEYALELLKIIKLVQHIHFFKIDFTEFLNHPIEDANDIVIDIDAYELLIKPPVITKIEYMYDNLYSQQKVETYLVTSPFYINKSYWIIIAIILVASIFSAMLKHSAFKYQCYLCDPNLKLREYDYDLPETEIIF